MQSGGRLGAALHSFYPGTASVRPLRTKVVDCHLNERVRQVRRPEESFSNPLQNRLVQFLPRASNSLRRQLCQPLPRPSRYLAVCYGGRVLDERVVADIEDAGALGEGLH